MPPKKNPNIVKSGNAGMSSKGQGSTKATDPKNNATSNSGASSNNSAGGASENKPLFPPGSKTPVSLLYER
jgi:hypothetical protein